MLILAIIALVWAAVVTVFVGACISAARADRRTTPAIRADRMVTVPRFRLDTDGRRLRTLT